jgi:hypothetical protein
MGYACPVCETPQRDADHLANHLAFTAVLHGDAHERWLDEHAPGWGEDGVAELAPVVADAADEAEYQEVFEERMPEGVDDERDGTRRSRPAGAVPDANVDADTRRVLAEARELTRAMLAADGDDDTNA